MNKKGDLTIQTVIIAILALLVLITLVIMFRTQLSALSEGFMNLISGTTETINGTDISELVK